MLEREAFRQGLVAAITEAGDRPYWESWLAALESLLAERGLA